MKACGIQGAGLMFSNLTCKFCGESYKESIAHFKTKPIVGKLKCETCGNDRFWGNKN